MGAPPLHRTNSKSPWMSWWQRDTIFIYIYKSISFPHWVPNGLFLGANKLVGPVSMKKNPPWNEHFSHLEIGWLEDDILSIWISAYFCGVNWLFVSGEWSNLHLNAGCIFFSTNRVGWLLELEFRVLWSRIRKRRGNPAGEPVGDMVDMVGWIWLDHPS